MQSIPTASGSPPHSGHCISRTREMECADNHPKKVAVNILYIHPTRKRFAKEIIIKIHTFAKENVLKGLK